MIDSIIKDYKSEVISILKKLESNMVQEYLIKYKCQLDDISKSLKKSNASLMFYGIYNAGKSSLLNAVFGKVTASVNDVPETHKVTSYKWRMYTLVDTPGLNGPPEDESITMQEISKHDIIMFVIDDSDNFDSDIITKKIIEILETGKPCIIVINKKNDSSQDRILGIKAKMNKNIQKLSAVSQSYEFVSVDAESALRAKKENKELLLSDSNIQELEYCISKKLSSVTGVKLLRVPLDLIIELCDSLIKKYDILIDGEESNKVLKLKQNLFSVKEQTKKEFEIALKNKVDSYSNEIYRQAALNQHSLIDEKQCEQEISNLIKKYSEEFEKQSKCTMSNFSSDIKLNLDISYVPDCEFNIKKSCTNNIKEEDDVDKILNAMEKIPIPIPIPIPVPLPIIVMALKSVKKLIFGSESDHKVDVDELNRQQAEYVQKREMALKEIKNQISIQMQSFYDTIRTSFENEIESTYKKSNEILSDMINEMTVKEKDILEKQENFKQIKREGITLKEIIG